MEIQLEGATEIAEVSHFRNIIIGRNTFKISKEDAMDLARIFKYETKGKKTKNDKAFVNITAIQGEIMKIEEKGSTQEVAAVSDKRK